MEPDGHSSPRAERYRHLRELGRGAMGVVDLVYDEVRGAPVARKRMHQLTSETRFQIKQEFRQAQEVRHPNLVRLYDLFTDDADAFFTMEPVFGADVSSEVQNATARLGAGSAEIVPIITARLQQLIDAVAALHAIGIVHRDIKPSNVLVEDSGRLVLLDFGFSSALASDFKESDDRALVGTIPYMAPECLWGAPPSPQSDWYGVGVIAAELCLGRQLFSGSLQAVLREKDRPPASLRAFMPHLPPALDELICGLLRRDPAARPDGGTQLRAALGSPESPPRGAPTPSGIASVFVGRAEELAELERGIPLAARAQVVRVHGPSGIGKTTLLRELTARLGRRASWIVFRGRCHPREHLALKALDSVMDEVSRHFKRLGPRACARIAALPGMDALTRMFPVLARLPEFAAIDADAGPADPQTRWIEGLRAFRSLWAALAASDRIAVWIDDLQWADRDGLKLLHEVISVEPRPPITWILSHRSPSATQGDDTAQFSKDAPDGSLELALGGLTRSDATELAIRFGASRLLAGEVEREAGGSPFMVSELTRSALSGGGLSSVDAVLEDRLGALDAHELAVVEHLALADGPLPAKVLPDVLAATVPVAAVLEHLESTRLVRLSYGGDSDQLAELYHDRIREAVAARMNDASRRAVHVRLGEALRRVPSVTRAALAFHYRRAGALEQGLRLTLEAAEECTQALAFEQAAQLYEEAVAIHGEPKPADLLERAADALARAGRCEDAARRYLEAASHAAEGAHRRTLQLRAGAHFLYAGRVSEGRQWLEAALRRQGLSWPRSPLLASLLERARVLLAGTQMRKPPHGITPELAERFDTLWAVTKGIAMVDHAAADALALRALREALRLGDPSRLVWALGHEAASEANIGGPYMQRRALTFLDQVRRIADQEGTPYDRAYVRMVQGVIAFFAGDCIQAENTLRDASRLYRDPRTGFLHEQNIVAAFRVSALEQQGNVSGLGVMLSDLRASAQHTGNLYSLFLFRTASAGLVTLADDRPLDAIRDADAALAAWPPVGFTAPHHYHLQVTLWARLYAGRAAEAWQQVERNWSALGRAHFLRLEAVGIQHRHLRARAALMAAESAGAGERSRLRRIATKEAAIIGKSRLPHAAAVQAAIEYGLAALAGEWELAARRCKSALAGFDGAGMSLAREAARLRSASLCTDREQGRREDEVARAWFAAAGVRNPEAMTASLMPGGVRSSLPRPGLGSG